MSKVACSFETLSWAGLIESSSEWEFVHDNGIPQIGTQISKDVNRTCDQVGTACCAQWTNQRDDSAQGGWIAPVSPLNSD